jgi:EthD domain
MSQIDYSARDQSGRFVFYVLLRKRKSITLELFDDYWRDVHGPVCARLPGQHQYWQHHLAHSEGGIWPQIDGICYLLPEDEQLDGIAELTFVSDEHRQKWFSEAAILMSDEHNLFSKAVGYITAENGSKTYLNRIEVGDLNSSPSSFHLHVLLKANDSVSKLEFQSYLVDRFTPEFLKGDQLLKFRLHLLEEHDNSEKLPAASGVSHFESLDKQYQASLEIAFKTRLDMEQFFSSESYLATVVDQPKYIKQVTTFPVRAIYTFVYDNEMTLAGQRGSSVAGLISDIGAMNQLQSNISNLMLGSSVR